MRTPTVPYSVVIASLLLPATASAGPIVWWQVPEYRVDNVDTNATWTASEDVAVMDHELAVERRDAAIDRAREDRDLARAIRAASRMARRQARKALRQAEREGTGIRAAASRLSDAERDLMEARDLVDLRRSQVTARKEHRQLERGRLSLAKAARELTEAEMLRLEDARGTSWHDPDRYERQVDRISTRVRARRADWNVARAEVRERSQDYRTPYVEYAVWTLEPEPSLEFVHPPGTVHGLVHPAETEQPTGTDDTSARLRRVRFDLGSASLDTDALNALAWDAHVLRENRDATVRIEGYTDATGSRAFNRELAWERAEAVEAFLLENGVWDSQLETAGFGENGLVVETPRAAAANRRAEMRVIEDPDGLVDGTVPEEIDWLSDRDAR